MTNRRAFLLLLASLTFHACTVPTTAPSASASTAPQASSTNPTLDYDLPLNLNNGQKIHLDMHIKGERIQGDLHVEEGPMRTQQFTRTFGLGRYAFTGGFSPPRGFTLQGTFPEPIGAFNLSGTLPTQTESGQFRFTQGGETVSGSLPPLNTLPEKEPAEANTETPTEDPIEIPTRQWKAEELLEIKDCLSAKTAVYQGANRSLLIQAVAKIVANVSLATNTEIPWNAQQRQDKLNEAGAFALNAELTLASACVR